MIDLNNPVFVAEWSPQAEWKRELLIHLGQRFNIDTFIETGTSTGGTVGQLRQYFKQVLSVEVERKVYEANLERFSDARNVHLYYGASSDILPRMIRESRTERALFWLDAHITGGTTINLGNQVPAEFKAIKMYAPDSLVLVDDVKPGPIGPEGPMGVPDGWTQIFLNGVLIAHAGGYQIPEKF